MSFITPETANYAGAYFQIFAMSRQSLKSITTQENQYWENVFLGSALEVFSI